MTLSAEEVRIAWQALCDEPLPDDTLIDQLSALPSLADFRRMMVETHGFQVSLPRHLGKVPIGAPFLKLLNSRTRCWHASISMAKKH